MKKRYYGIDLLRSISMLMIVVLHVLGVGGVLSAAGAESWHYRAAWLLETICMCSVNCFGLVSGYVLCKGRHHYSRLVSLWIRVVTESLLVTAVFALVLPGSATRTEWVRALTPIYHNVFWYFTAYFGLHLFVPFINRMLAVLSRRELLVLSGTIVLVFCVLNNITPSELYIIGAGYSFLWLCCLYILGGALRRLDIKTGLNKWLLFGAFAMPLLLSWGLSLALDRESVIGYTSPFTLCAAVALFLLFRELDISSPRAIKAISMLSRTSFGVYIIHTNQLVWALVLYNRFAPYAGENIALMLLLVLATAVGIYLVCTAADWLVEKLLKLARIEKLEKLIDVLCEKAGISRQKVQNTASK